MIKIDIISGFLGSGKTTFINMLLKSYKKRGLRPVCIVNEFGVTGLDAGVINSGGFEAVEMEGGCICCTLKDDIEKTIALVIEKYNPTNIVFEPSGIFVFSNFFDIIQSENLKDKCVLGSIVTIVDSLNFNFSKISFGSFIYNQIKNSPKIVISKLERYKCNPDELICDIKNINPDAIIFSKEWSLWEDGDFLALASESSKPLEESSLHYHEKFKTLTIYPDMVLKNEQLDRLCSLCTEGSFGDIIRLKGILNVEGHKFLINIAFKDITVEKINGVTKPSLTFIGNSLNGIKIKGFFDGCRI